MGYRGTMSAMVSMLAEAYLAAGQLPAASDEARRALALARECGERFEEARALRVLGHVHAHPDHPDLEAADQAYQQSLVLATALDMRPLVAECHLGLATLSRLTGNRHQAEEHLIIARTMFREMDMRFWLEQAARDAALGDASGSYVEHIRKSWACLSLVRVRGVRGGRGNTDKNWLRHAVGQAEAEQTLLNTPLVLAAGITHSQAEARFIALGQTDTGRGLAVVFTVRGNRIRVISARTMSKTERRVYGQAEAKPEADSRVCERSRRASLLGDARLGGVRRLVVGRIRAISESAADGPRPAKSAGAKAVTRGSRLNRRPGGSR